MKEILGDLTSKILDSKYGENIKIIWTELLYSRKKDGTY
jgi:hypothetical protein